MLQYNYTEDLLLCQYIMYSVSAHAGSASTDHLKEMLDTAIDPPHTSLSPFYQPSSTAEKPFG